MSTALRRGPLFPPTTEQPLPEGSTGWRMRFGLSAGRIRRSGAQWSRRHIQCDLRHSRATRQRRHGRQGRTSRSAGSTSPTSGSWMFEVDRVNTGDRFLWVAHPHSTAVCTALSDSPWSCSQTSLTYPQGNSWLLAIAFYLPLTELGWIGASNSDTSTSRQMVNGLPVECLTDKIPGSGATLRWCLTSTGVLASFSAVPQNDGDTVGGAPADGTITAVSGSAPDPLFTLPARPGQWAGPLAPPVH